MAATRKSRLEHFGDLIMFRRKAPRWANWTWFLGSCAIYVYSIVRNAKYADNAASYLGLLVVPFIDSFWDFVYWNLAILALVAVIDVISGNEPELEDPEKVMEHRLKNFVP
jgi:hypothetical protein